MRRSIFIARLAVAAIVLLTGCAGPSGGVGSGSSHPDGVAHANGDALKGTWRGVFEQVQTGDSGRIHGDLECQIKEDGTYQMTWTTDLVAGSTRGGRVVMSGTVAADGNLVSFDEPTSGSRTTLRRVGDTLYGVRVDPGTKRVSVSVEMHRMVAPEAP